MARLVDQLTEVKSEISARPVSMPMAVGLYLQVRHGGARSWIYHFTLNGRTRDKGISALADVGLAAAQARAADCRALVVKGTDPIEHPKAGRSAATVAIAFPAGPTFREAAEKYMDEN